jgi:hypothetical protein
MITQYEVPFLLKEAIPQMPPASEIQASRFITTDIYTSINAFSLCTKHAVEEHNFNLARKCFSVAEELYIKGDGNVRLLIENIFVYSFSSLVPADRAEKLILKTIFSPSLYAVYLKQVSGGLVSI